MRRPILSHLFKWIMIILGCERETHLRGKNSYKTLRDKGEEKSVSFSHTHERMFFILQLRIRSLLDWVDFLDSKFYTRNTSNCSIESSKRYLKREISFSHSLLYILGFHLLVSIVPIEGLF